MERRAWATMRGSFFMLSTRTFMEDSMTLLGKLAIAPTRDQIKLFLNLFLT